jgi:hypothetical protein
MPRDAPFECRFYPRNDSWEQRTCFNSSHAVRAQNFERPAPAKAAKKEKEIDTEAWCLAGFI